MKTTSVSSPFAGRSSTNLLCLSHFPFCRSASASTINYLQDASIFPDCTKSPRNSGPPSLIMATTSGSGPHYGGRGNPVLSHEGSDLEVRTMTNDVQYRKGLTEQGNAKHVQMRLNSYVRGTAPHIDIRVGRTRTRRVSRE